MTDLTNRATPELNIEVFCLLYEVEVVLRELIVATLSDVRGNGWAKQSLPSDVLEKYQRGKKAERDSPWMQYVAHHPIYYIDFPDLAKIIESGTNWRGFFDEIFRRREVIISALRSVEPIRNKIAHNRIATAADLTIVRGVRSQLASAVGEARFEALARSSTTAETAPDKVLRLRDEAKRSLLACLAFERLPPNEQWRAVSSEWWFDNDVLELDLGPVEAYFAAIAEYAELPRLRGAGYTIERWVRSKNIEQLHRNADLALLEILKAV